MTPDVVHTMTAKVGKLFSSLKKYTFVKINADWYCLISKQRAIYHCFENSFLNN